MLKNPREIAVCRVIPTRPMTKVDVLNQSLHTTVKSLNITDEWLRPKLIILTQGWESQVNPIRTCIKRFNSG